VALYTIFGKSQDEQVNSPNSTFGRSGIGGPRAFSSGVRVEMVEFSGSVVIVLEPGASA
jgi:hypothetical protein